MNCIVCGSPTGLENVEDTCSKECYNLYIGNEDEEESEESF